MKRGYYQIPFMVLLCVFFSSNLATAQCDLSIGSGDCDGDGILNSVDLDNDNDGILDADEIFQCLKNSSPIAIATGNNIPDESRNICGQFSNGGGVDHRDYEFYTNINEEAQEASYEARWDVESLYAGNSFPINWQLYCGNLDLANNGSVAAELYVNGVLLDQIENDGNSALKSGNFSATANSAQIRLVIRTTRNGSDLCEEPNVALPELTFRFTLPSTIIAMTEGDCDLNDFDRDGIPNKLDLDSDNDGIYDIVESGGIALDANNDGMIDAMLNPAAGDADLDGLADILEAINGANQGNLPRRTLGTGTVDMINIDSDEDKCSDASEAYNTRGVDDGYGSYNPTGLTEPFSVGAGVNSQGLVSAASYRTGDPYAVRDGVSANSVCNVPCTDCDGDGVPSSEDPDDNDPCTPQQSAGYTGYDSTNVVWAAFDCDGDGIANGTEATNGTDPYQESGDTDGDGILDDHEINNGTDETDPCDPVQPEGYTGYDSTNAIWGAADCDGDGVTNSDEVSNGTEPYNGSNDTDGDGIIDDVEINNGTDETDPCDPVQSEGYTGYDTTNTIWAASDCDGDGVTNGDEASNGTDPYEGTLDTDEDGITDDNEVNDGTDQNDPCDPNPNVSICDSDNDGLNYAEEQEEGTDPNNPDSDGDGVSDGDEVMIDATAPLDPCDFVELSITLPVINEKPCIPDYSPTLFASSAIVIGDSGDISFNVLVGESEGVDASSPVEVRISKSEALVIGYDSTLTMANNENVSNSDWMYDDSYPGLHRFVYVGNGGVFPGGTASIFGVNAAYIVPPSSKGSFSLKVTVKFGSGGEIIFSNNEDTESITFSNLAE